MAELVVLTDVLHQAGLWTEDRSDLAPEEGSVVTLVRAAADEALPYICFIHDREMTREQAGEYLGKVTYALAHYVG
jgi:hypothetical protein